MSASESTHVGAGGPKGKRRRGSGQRGPAPVVRKPARGGVGRYSARLFDPVTGRRKVRAS